MEDSDGLVFGVADEIREDGTIKYIKIPAMAWGRKEAKVPEWEAMADHDGNGLLPAPMRGGPGERVKTQYVGFLPSGLAHEVVDEGIKEVRKLDEHINQTLEKMGMKDEEKGKVQDWRDWFQMAATMDSKGDWKLAK